MPPLVTNDDVAKFQEDGAIILRGIFSQEWVDKVKEGIKINLSNPSEYSEKLALKKGQGAYFNDYCNWQKISQFEDFAFNSPAAEISATLMKSKYAVFYHEHVLNKEPGTEKETPWHHDQAYYPVDGWNVCSIWMPVDHVPLQSSLKCVKGSHRWGRWFHPRKFATELRYDEDEEVGVDCLDTQDRLYEDVPVEDIDKGQHEILSWACAPGDCVVFHGLTVHGAKGNQDATSQRRVLSTRWVGKGVTIARRPWKVSPPILGGLQYGDRMVSPTFPLVWGSLC